MRNLLIQVTGFTILLAFIARVTWSIVRNSKRAWELRQVIPVVSCNRESIVTAEVVIAKIDGQKLALDGATTFDQVPAEGAHLSTAQQTLPPPVVTPTTKVLSGEAHHVQTALATFYNVYSGVSPRARLL